MGWALSKWLEMDRFLSINLGDRFLFHVKILDKKSSLTKTCLSDYGFIALSNWNLVPYTIHTMEEYWLASQDRHRLASFTTLVLQLSTNRHCESIYYKCKHKQIYVASEIL